MNGEFNMMIWSIFPEICLVILAGIVLIYDLFSSEEKKGAMGWIVIAGLAVTAVLSLMFAQPSSDGQLLWGGMMRFDRAGFIFCMLFITGAALTALFAMDNDELGLHGEFYILLLVSTIGMSFMAVSADLIMLYLAIETTSIPLYVLAGFLRKNQKSAESGIKYLLYGALTSAVMLYGFSLLYGFTGTTHLYDIANRLAGGDVPVLATIGILMLVLVGFGYKISMVPFHFWAPDVYEGAPTPVAGFLSTASKAAGFMVLIRFLFVVYPNWMDTWMIMVAVLSVLSMFVGNLLAMAQKNIKRLLAYSSIAQAGYILIGVAAGNSLGVTAATYYLISYLLTNLVAFGVVSIVGRNLGSNDLSAYAGLSRRSPGLSIIFLVSILSLAGIPPMAGFTGKLLVLSAAMESGMVWLVILGIINSIIALYYYLNILKVVYLYRSEEEEKPLGIARPWVVGLSLCAIGVIIIGTIIAPWFGLSAQAAISQVF